MARGCVGGISNSNGAFSTVILNNTIVAGNTTATTFNSTPDFYGAVSSASSNNIIGDNQGMTGISNGVNGNQVGTASDPIDPRLAALADNGGQTKTHALLAGSPAIDTGKNTLAVDENNNPLTTDQRGAGFSRLSNGAVDIGAFEAQNTSTTYNVSGIVSYGTTPVNQTAKFVSGVLLTISGASSNSSLTDSAGAYSLNNLNSNGTTNVIASKTGNINGITPFDATLVLRCVAAGANCALTNNQKLAADTNNSNSITPFDATQILRFVAANGQTTVTGEVGNWKFNPALRQYASLSNSLIGENYEAILIGGVNGSWMP